MHKHTLSPKAQILLLAVLILAALIFFSLTFGPYIILETARQPAPQEHQYSEFFVNSYDAVRTNLVERVEKLMQVGVPVQYSAHPIDYSDNLFIDNIYIPATKKNKNLIVLTTGVHGIEGYVGSAMIDVFFEDVFHTIDRSSTGILIVANVNPYGMKYMRRYNENNVDLNRNFIEDWSTFDRSSNKEYPKVFSFLQPEGKIQNALLHEAQFYLSLAKEAIFTGADTISDALLTGQYEYPDGVYYGGNGDEASTTYLKGAFGKCLDSSYENIVHIDIHTGYGPRYNMVIFNSVQDPTLEADAIAEIGYNHIIAKDSEEFYLTYGDTTDYFYRLAKSKNTDKSLYSTCFEFGTIGDGFFDSILSLKYTVDENRQHRFPTNDEISAEIVRQNYLKLFYPTEKEWRLKAIEDFTTAIKGVLNAKLK